MPALDLASIRCVVFDFGFTVSSDLYFQIAPPNCPMWHTVIQHHVFADPAVVLPWMEGRLTLTDIATIIATHIPLPIADIRHTLEQGSMNVTFNPAVWDFACAQRAQGRKTALVTTNGIPFKGIRLYEENRAHWLKKQQVLLELKDEFEREGNLVIYNNRLSECTDHDRTLDGRYLYIVNRPESGASAG